jgi:hypothetical protein
MNLTMKEVVFLADQFPNKTTISLFSTLQAKLDGTEEESLRKKGIISNGHLSSEAKAILEVVAYAKQASRLIVRDSLSLLEKYTYRVDDIIALVENRGDDIEVSLPEDFSTIGYELSQFIGMASRKTTGIEIVLSKNEIMTLLTLIDIYREQALALYLEEKVVGTICLESIRSQWKKSGENGLVHLFRTDFGYPLPADGSLKQLLAQLIEKGCVMEDEGYHLSPEYALFAKQFLIPDTMIIVESFSINEEDLLIVGGGMGIAAGVRDQAFFIADNEEVEMKAVAGLEMIQTIEGFLACPVL